jgi:hypothetical protein
MAGVDSVGYAVALCTRTTAKGRTVTLNRASEIAAIPDGPSPMRAGTRIEEGHFADVDISGVNVGLFIDIPGPLTRGNWTAGLFIGDNASIYATKGLIRIFTGRAGGSTSLLKLLVGSFLGVQQTRIEYRIEGDTRIFDIPKIVEGVVKPIAGKQAGEPVMIRNTGYWVAPEVTVARAERARVRAFGRSWNFAGLSAELCRLDSSGP